MYKILKFKTFIHKPTRDSIEHFIGLKRYVSKPAALIT